MMQIKNDEMGEDGKKRAKITENTCCGGPAPKEIDACCVADAEAKAMGKAGCGCGKNC